MTVTRILEAIYEQDFLRCSYGYRPNVGALDAVDKLTVKLQFGQYHFIVEADIKSYFDTIDHDWLVRMLEERINDKQLMFEYQCEAERFCNVLGLRLGKFGLELAAAKTRIIPFDRRQSKTGFDFLGFEFRWGKDRAGKPHLKRRIAPKKLRKSIQNFTEWCKQNRSLRLKDLFRQLNAKLRGYYNYYGIFGNGKSLNRFYQQAIGVLFKWLNRRSFNWDGFKQLLDRFKIERPHNGKQPKTLQAMAGLRLDCGASTTEKPGAGKLHAGICAGGVE